ncbi:hypothetical protein GGX14DRAFT_643005 [Mycena pura]|uniref:Crinkler family protein n=1 Tax=Mycena pura TaxID=153505 RepID=A0AAD6YR73_9AGAR|nr:hypothetical protein GGX14DRAFT_643005 [Mycena pura]
MPVSEFDSSKSYARFHKLLWQPPTLEQPTTAEPSAFTKFIGEGNSNVVDLGPLASPCTGPPQRFIDLEKYPEFIIKDKVDGNTFLIRTEYKEFMDHIRRFTKKEDRRFFLTGQPGIGKQLQSVGLYYLLFWLLAIRQPVFLFPNSRTFYYFSEKGVEKAPAGFDSDSLEEAVKRSWLLMDVDVGDGTADTWYPPDWTIDGSAIVWSSSPRQERLRRFTSTFSAYVWYMTPWSLEEIVFMTRVQRRKADPAEIRKRLNLTGPVARTLFVEKDAASTEGIDKVIRHSIKQGLLEFPEANPDCYLVRPEECLDENGVLCLNRKKAVHTFLTIHIASRTTDLVEESGDNFRKRLARAFDSPQTRGAAGQLVESILHRAVVKQSVDPFGVGGKRLSVMMMIGKASEFILESHRTSPSPPLYVRPDSPNLTSVDAIVVTDSVLWLVQSSLGDWHPLVFRTLLAIILQLEKRHLKLDDLRLVYCLVGTDERRVRSIVCSATEKFLTLRAATAADQAQELRQQPKDINSLRLMGLEIEGYWFAESLEQLARVVPAPREDKGKGKRLKSVDLVDSGEEPDRKKSFTPTARNDH